MDANKTKTKNSMLSSKRQKPWLVVGIAAAAASVILAPLVQSSQAAETKVGSFAIHSIDGDGYVGEHGKLWDGAAGPVAGDGGNPGLGTVPNPPTTAPDSGTTPLASLSNLSCANSAEISSVGLAWAGTPASSAKSFTVWLKSGNRWVELGQVGALARSLSLTGDALSNLGLGAGTYGVGVDYRTDSGTSPRIELARGITVDRFSVRCL